MDTDKATEESKGALDKVRKRFFDDIIFPKLIVKGIRLGFIKLGSWSIICLHTENVKDYYQTYLS